MLENYPKIAATEVPPLYHGTNNSVEIQKCMIKASTANAGSLGISKFVWFHDNVADASAYCIFSSSKSDCHVLEYCYSGISPIIDLRNTCAEQIKEFRNGKLLSEVLDCNGYGGALISPTVNGGKDEWGIVNPSNLNYVRALPMSAEWYNQKHAEQIKSNNDLINIGRRTAEIKAIEDGIRARKS